MAYLFNRKGVVLVDKTEDLTEDDVLLAVLDAGAEEVNDLDEAFEVQAEAGDLHAVRAGDRYLLCTDGLHAVVTDPEFEPVLAGAADPGAAVGALIALAMSAGAPDNVACAVADVVAIPA